MLIREYEGARIVGKHLPCPCGKSSDAYSEREDGSGFCFSCNKNFRNEETLSKENINDPSIGEGVIEYKILPFRGLTEGTLKRYNMITKIVNGVPSSVSAPYNSEFSKIRNLEKKAFYYVGKPTAGCFGKLAFPDPGDSIVITEGELDAPSAYQMLGIPAISVRSSSSAKNDVLADYEYINKFSKIYICFDGDEPGRLATQEVAPIFDFKKIFILDPHEFKDANDFLQNGKTDAFRALFKKARKFVPEGVISSYSDISGVLDGPSRSPICDLPFSGLNQLLQGIATGESILFSGLEGIGKTEVLRAIEHKVLKETDYNIGIVHLEESQKATVNRLLSYEMEAPLYRSDVMVDKEDKLKSYADLTRRDNRVFYYSFNGEHDPDALLGIFRYLVVVCGCKVIFFDHINIVVSSMDAGSDERKTLDYLCTKISSLIQELDFSLIFISHENDDGKTRGSRNISQTAHVRVHMERSIDSADKLERNRVYFSVHKNRPTALSGPAGYAWYDTDVGVLRDPDVIPDSDFLTALPE